MQRDWTYAISLTCEADEIHAYCRDLPEAIASGSNENDALREMSAALVAAVRGRIKDGTELSAPRPSIDAIHRISLPAQLAAKASVYSAWKTSGLSKSGLGSLIGRSEAEVRRILDPDYGTKLDQLAEAAAGLGGRLSVSFAAK